jgi:hypothetical protein
MINYASDIVILGMFAFLGCTLGAAFIHWLQWVNWNQESKNNKKNN